MLAVTTVLVNGENKLFLRLFWDYWGTIHWLIIGSLASLIFLFCWQIIMLNLSTFPQTFVVYSLFVKVDFLPCGRSRGPCISVLTGPHSHQLFTFILPILQPDSYVTSGFNGICRNMCERRMCVVFVDILSILSSTHTPDDNVSCDKRLWAGRPVCSLLWDLCLPWFHYTWRHYRISCFIRIDLLNYAKHDSLLHRQTRISKCEHPQMVHGLVI